MAKKPTKRGRPRKATDKTATKVEIEARLRITERCISMGVYDVESIFQELSKQGHKVSIRSTYGYIRRVRERIAEESSDLRSLRKAILIRDTQRYERIIFGKLMDSDIKPLWKDLVAILKIRERVEAGKYDELIAAPVIATPEDDFEGLEGKTPAELDELIMQMVAKSTHVGGLPESDDPKPLH